MPSVDNIPTTLVIHIMEIMMPQDRITLIPSSDRTLVRKSTTDNAPTKVGGLLLPNDKANETLVRCQVVFSHENRLASGHDLILVEADKLSRSVSVNSETLYIIENNDVLGIFRKGSSHQ